MGTMKLGRMTLRSLFSKPETVRYPLETKPAPAGLKGHIENNIDTCILCSKCVKACPADALAVSRDEQTWTINRFRCVQCGSCVRACPTDSLAMLPEYQTPAPGKFSMTNRKPQADPDEAAAKEAERAARIAAAKAAKAARLAAQAQSEA